jgi:hypothetical protein
MEASSAGKREYEEDESSTGRNWAAWFHHATARYRLARVLEQSRLILLFSNSVTDGRNIWAVWDGCNLYWSPTVTGTLIGWARDRLEFKQNFGGESVMDNVFHLDLSTDAQEGTTMRDKAFCIHE